ncbi:MAG: dTMP kinase [Anaerolineae bacterium]|nr:dTMP kinase [Anaerolineales bacterium]MCQ3977756.1 dTMP kinase [Anaerolineae bacterium]
MSLFITFEGPDGSGKSTQINLVTAHLERLGYEVLCTREPGGTAIGDQIRQVLHDVKNTEMSARAEILLYSASRAQLVEQVILPHLAQGGVVLCDRYADSTYAYQGYGRRLDFETLRLITNFATQRLKPDLTIYLDVAVEEGLRRKAAANVSGQGEWNRMDQLELEFHQRVRAGYLEMAQQEPGRWLIVDASAPVEEINAIICERLEQVLSVASSQRSVVSNQKSEVRGQ